MTERDYLLALIASTPRPLGRTALQKLAYLLAARRHAELRFQPHFYGPYSQGLQNELERLRDGGLVSETAMSLEPPRSVPFETYQYSYELTPDGAAVLASVDKGLREQARRLIDTAQTIGALTPGALSMAAKLHHIQEIEPTATPRDIPDLARRFGWRMTEHDAERGERLLRELRLVA